MWALVELPEGDIKNSEVIALYELLSYSTSEKCVDLAKKLEKQYELAKHDKLNALKTWEDEGGAAAP